MTMIKTRSPPFLRILRKQLVHYLLAQTGLILLSEAVFLDQR